MPVTGPWWDETGLGGHPCRLIAPHDIPDALPDWVPWSVRLTGTGDPPPPGMRPQGRSSAERAARTLRRVAFLLAAVAATGLAIWSLGALR